MSFRSAVRRHLPWAVEFYRELRFLHHEQLAVRKRARCEAFVGITGSCGKSTTTYLTGQMLGRQRATEVFVGHNSRVSIFHLLATSRQNPDFIVQEISGHQPGAIERVCRRLRPDVAVVTTVGNDHFASFKGEIGPDRGAVAVKDQYLAAIAREKGSLVAAVSPHGIACLNADDPRVRAMRDRTSGDVLLYGTAEDADIRAENVTARWPERLSFDLIAEGTRRRVQTRFVGTLALTSVLAALTAVRSVGGDLDQAIVDLATIEPFDKRMSVHEGADGHTYVLDTVKAPLWQVEALIADLPSLRSTPLVLLLGEISDVRNDKSTQYRKLLRQASLAADHVIGFGPAASSARKVRGDGFENVEALETYDAVHAYLAALAPSLVVLKSNKSVNMNPIWENR